MSKNLKRYSWTLLVQEPQGGGLSIGSLHLDLVVVRLVVVRLVVVGLLVVGGSVDGSRCANTLSVKRMATNIKLSCISLSFFLEYSFHKV